MDTLSGDVPDNATVLQLDGVTKRFGRVLALDALSLALRPGELTCLMGPNGAGKTTLFQILSGLISADSGQVAVLGLDLRRSAPKALARIGLVFQQPTLDPELTVAANLRFHARLHGLPAALARKRMTEELERVGLGDKPRVRVGTLSGGTRRRVELARALLHDPELLLMDEPTAGLDPGSRIDLLRHVRTLIRERDLSVLWATHLVDEAEQADRVVVLHRGRMLADAAPPSLVRQQGGRTLQDAFFGLVGDADGEDVAPAAE